MTRRTLLQAVLLALLAGAAAWLYLAPAGGLPGVVTALLLGESPTPAPPVPAAAAEPSGSRKTAAPAPREPRVAQPASASPPVGAHAVPSQPVEGEIGGKRFHVDAASIESSTLRLRQLEPPLALALVLPVNPWQVPAGRSFEVLAPEERGADTPLVRVSLPGAPDRAYAQRYTLWLEFGHERNGTLPGRLHLVLPDTAGSRVAGTFVAEIRGFRFIDGKPDLSADSAGTFEYLALREILGGDPTLALEDLAFGAARLVPAGDGVPASGRLEVSYRSNGEMLRQTFNFIKEDGRWRVHEVTGVPVQKDGGQER